MMESAASPGQDDPAPEHVAADGKASGAADRDAVIVRERLRIARDLHDTLAHSMAALLTQIRLMRKLARTAPERVEGELEIAEQVALDGLREARAAVIGMRYQAVRDDGFGAALGRLCKRARLRKGLDITLHVDSAAFVLADERVETVFRIVEEAIQNIERHAGVEAAWIDAEVSEANGRRLLRVTVRDEGRGFDPLTHTQNRYGVRGMNEQAAAVGAEISVASAPGAGTRIVISMPV